MAPGATPDQNMIYWMGHAAQFFLAPVKPEDAKVLEVDGIQLTPDFETCEFAGYKVDLAEMKSTRKSSRTFHPKDQMHYLMQIMGYCKALGKTKADLIMYFIHGDYSQRPPAPELDCWACEFTQQEIDANWEHVKECRDILDRALKEGRPPDPIIMLGDWECDYCECGGFCPQYKPQKRKRE